MTMWIGVYTRVSPFTLASILYHRSSWMSSVCGKLFERKTGTPTSSGPRLPTHRRYNYGHQGYRHPWWHLYHITGSPFCQVFLSKFLKKFLKKFFWGSGRRWEPPPLMYVHIYAYVCVYTCVHPRTYTGTYTQAPTDTRPLAPFWPVLKRSLKGGGHGGGMMVDWTQNDTPFSTVILTLNFDPKNRPFQVTVWERSEATNEGERSEPKKPSP